MLLKEIESYAILHNVPIMPRVSIDFISEILIKTQSRSILEVGTAIAYSSIAIKENVPEIEIDTIERDIIRYNEALKNIERSQLDINCIYADALHYKNNKNYDVIILDAAKAQNEPLFKLYFAYTNKLMIVDNIDFHGHTGKSEAIESKNLKQMVKRIEQFLEYINSRNDLEVSYHKVGDGMVVIRRKGFTLV